MIRVISATDVAGVLDYPTAINTIEEAFREQGKGEIVSPIRQSIRVEKYGGFSSFMPAYLSGKDRLGIKVISAYQKNRELFGLPTVIGSIILLDARSGAPIAIVDGTSITAIRTAAASAVATKYMARGDASSLGIFGAGVQSETHIRAISVVRDVSKVLVTSRDSGKCDRFCKEMSLSTGLSVRQAAPREVAAQDIVVTATTSSIPVIDGDWLCPGAHVNAIGSHSPMARELDEKSILSSRVVVDSLEANLREAGDFLIPMAQGKFSKEMIYAELGDVVLGRKKGRESNEEKTLFKSVGLAIEDIAAASVVFERAAATGKGREVTL